MLRRWLVATLVCFGLTVAAAKAQNLCPSGVQSDKLICLLPQVYGVNGLELTNTGAEFQNNFLTSNLRPLNSALARQSTLLSQTSPSSGLEFIWDPVNKVFLSATESFGPVFSERAETIGRHRVFLASGYEYIQFDSLDGINLKNLPVVFTQPDVTVDFSPPVGTRNCSVNGDNTDFCGFIRDVITTENRIGLKIHRISTSVTYGITNRIDVSMVIPIENVRMQIISDATIVNNSNSKVHSFPVVPNSCEFPCRHQVFTRSRTASGIGDITLRAKGKIWEAEHARLAVGVDVRFPTGDSLNFIGAGAYGVRPFVAWSYDRRMSPHVVVGYESNGSSKIAGDITTGSKERLPSQFTYSAGADIWLTKRLTTAFDLVGQQVFQAPRTSEIMSPEPGACKNEYPLGCTAPFDDPKSASTLKQYTGALNVTSLSLGAKVRPFSNFLITGNVLIKLNENSLRARAIPFLSFSYVF